MSKDKFPFKRILGWDEVLAYWDEIKELALNPLVGVCSISVSTPTRPKGDLFTHSAHPATMRIIPFDQDGNMLFAGLDTKDKVDALGEWTEWMENLDSELYLMPLPDTDCEELSISCVVCVQCASFSDR